MVRNVVQLHGGTIQASSPGLGRGSVFTLTLPLPAQVAPPEALPAAHAAALRRHRILLVEDNRDASDLLCMYLRSEGYTVSAAFDGPTGLAMAGAQHFDVLVCDIGLPGLNGYSLMRKLKETLGASTPFAIAASGYGQQEDRVMATAAGFDQYLVKPIDVNAILHLLESVPEHV
nr:response regulator [Massilia glaciei]